jgi:hypothetical protein
MAQVAVTYRCRTGLLCAWVRLMAILAPVVGRVRAYDWAARGARRLLRVKVIESR